MSSGLLALRIALRTRQSLNNFRFTPFQTYYSRHSSFPQSHERTYWQKLWYRQDGNQRSRVTGLVYAGVLCLIATLTKAAIEQKEYNHNLSLLAKWQRIDSKYFSDNSFDDSDIIALYVWELLGTLQKDFCLKAPKDQYVPLFRFSRKIAPENYENVLKILEKIHRIFMRDQLPEKTVKEVGEAFVELFEELGQLAEKRIQWFDRQKTKDTESQESGIE